MGNSIFSFALLFLLSNTSITLCFCSTILNSTTDKNSLSSFKNSITSDPYAILTTNWSENASVCNWIGVSCGAKHLRVMSLNLSGFDLSGTVAPHLGNLTFLRYLDISSNNFTGLLPFDQLFKLRRLKVMNVALNSLTGEIPEDIGNIYSLEILNLNNNRLTGSVPRRVFNVPSLTEIRIRNNSISGWLPSDMCNNMEMSNIKTLSLALNKLQGQIPPNIWKCRNLEILELSYNNFNGSIPVEIGRLSMLRHVFLGFNDFQAEIGNLSRLEILNIDNSSLTGRIPSSIFNISSLKNLGFNDNSLSGTIPDLHNLPELEHLYLDNNKFTGSIPSDMCDNLLNIQTLSLSGNQLQGKIPSNIWKCRNLRFLGLSLNNLSGSIPPEIGNLSLLTVLYLTDNVFTGELPKEIGNLPNLDFFSVFRNSLSGSIPASIFNISTLRSLGLSYNEFSGTLPSDFGHSLENVILSNNRFNGPIPASITNASKLTLLDMANNSFSGSIPNLGSLRFLQKLGFWGNNLSGAESPTHELTFLSSLTNCPNLRDLKISYNPLNGILPASIGNFSSSFELFFANDCNITGLIPSEIGNLSGLHNIYMPRNQLSGTIPPTIGKLKQLQRIDLSTNQLVGSIPNVLCRMDNLGEINFASNMLVGSIPECLGDVKSLRLIDLGSNQLNSTIPHNFWTLTDLVSLNFSSNYLSGQLSSQLGNLKAIYTLDLSFNQFLGRIPTIIDGCQSLETLNLSNNFFIGSIPTSLGNVRGLTTLDLSCNNLSGLIPKSLENLNFLQHFNVSNNILEGEIPNGGHFGNFTSQSFSHNSDLCGVVRFEVEPCSKKDGGSRVNKVSRLIKYMVPSLIVLVIAMIVILVFIRRRKQKLAIPVDISPTMKWRIISYLELERGTNCFSETNLIGRGGFGSVFEATLSDGLKVAVKVFNMQIQRAVMSFDTEAEIMSGIRHRNLVRLIGCCSNTEFKALILAYMPNGSLDRLLYSNNYSLDLVQRLKIAIDVAAALEYLHHGYTSPVVHCDVKPSNVLLDEDMTAHLADFGISKLFEGGEAFIQTQTLATIGYAAPEYGMEGKVSTNGDVYSFGILLLEMLTEKKPTDDMFVGEMSIKEWVNEALQQNAATKIVAASLLSKKDQHFSAKEKCVSSMFELAMKCLVVSADERINMIEAAATLQKIKATMAAATERHRPRYAHSVSIGDH